MKNESRWLWGVFAAVCATAPIVAASPPSRADTPPLAADELMARDIGVRTVLGLASEPAYVASLYSGSNLNRDFGFVATESERVEMQARVDLDHDAERVHAWAQETGISDDFGGTYVDQSGGGVEVALFCGRGDPNLETLRSIVAHPARITVRTCHYSETRLLSVVDTLNQRLVAGELPLVTGVDLDTVANVVLVATAAENAAQVQSQVANLGDEVRVIVRSPAVKASGGITTLDDPAPHIAGVEIHSPAPGGAPDSFCTLGFAILDSYGRDSSLSAGHCGTYGDVWQNGTGLAAGGPSIGLTLVSIDNGPNDALQMLDQYTNGARKAWVANNYPGELHVSGTAPVDQVGSYRCISGAQSMTHCGIVTSVSSTRSAFDRTRLANVMNTDLTAVCDATPAVLGDSGAPIWSPSGGSALASGVESIIETSPSTYCLTRTTPPQTAPRQYHTWIYVKLGNALTNGAVLDTR